MALLEPSVRKIAVDNPEQAPHGRAAVAALGGLVKCALPVNLP